MEHREGGARAARTSSGAAVAVRASKSEGWKA
eukprot:SAG11_NODE_21991_length_414_cov_1.260317_1_plen_31_part_10